MPEPTEWSLIQLLRRWKCVSHKCGHEHVGEPSYPSNQRFCPQCNCLSVRTHEVVATAGGDASLASYTVILKKPTRGKLASMALRYDHAIFAPKQELFGHMFGGQTPVQIAATMTTMMQLHEEVAETGFYKPEREPEYCRMLDGALRSAAETKSPGGDDV